MLGEQEDAEIENSEGAMIYLCRWPNGDVSLAVGRNRKEIDYILDEVSDPGAAEVSPLQGPFGVHFKLKETSDDAETIFDLLEFESVNERTWMNIVDAYPLLAGAFNAEFELKKGDATPTKEQIAVARAGIEAALQEEKERLVPKEDAL